MNSKIIKDQKNIIDKLKIKNKELNNELKILKYAYECLKYSNELYYFENKELKKELNNE